MCRIYYAPIQYYIPPVIPNIDMNKNTLTQRTFWYKRQRFKDDILFAPKLIFYTIYISSYLKILKKKYT